MSLKKILGLGNSRISECEIMNKIVEAQKKDLDEVEFVSQDGTITKVSLPHLHFYPEMYDTW